MDTEDFWYLIEIIEKAIKLDDSTYKFKLNRYICGLLIYSTLMMSI